MSDGNDDILIRVETIDGEVSFVAVTNWRSIDSAIKLAKVTPRWSKIEVGMWTGFAAHTYTERAPLPHHMTHFPPGSGGYSPTDAEAKA